MLQKDGAKWAGWLTYSLVNKTLQNSDLGKWKDAQTSEFLLLLFLLYIIHITLPNSKIMVLTRLGQT